MKRSIIISIICFSCLILTQCKNNNSGNKQSESTEATEQVQSSQTAQRDNVKRVYCCAYDGFVNVRKEPSYSAEKIGQFKNGSQGAVELEVLKDWTKIEFNGAEGYVPSKYVQNAPTVEYTGDATADWIEGIWGTYVFIFNNGTWASGYDYETSFGTWIMEGKGIKFTPVSCDEGLEPFEGFYIIDKANNILVDQTGYELERNDFITEQEKQEAIEEEMSLDYGSKTKAEFKRYRKEVSKRLSR